MEGEGAHDVWERVGGGGGNICFSLKTLLLVLIIVLFQVLVARDKMGLPYNIFLFRHENMVWILIRSTSARQT